MKKIILILLAFNFVLAQAQEVVDVREDIILTTSSDTTWKQLYRSTPEKINNLVHTKLEVRFDYDKSYLYGKAWITLQPHFYATDSLTLDAKAMDIKTVALFANGKTSPLKYVYDSSQLRIKLDKMYNKGQQYIVYIDYVARPDEYKSNTQGLAITDSKGLYFINPKGTEAGKPTQIWTQGEPESNSVWFPTIDKPNQKMTHEIAMTVPDKYVSLSNGLMTSSKKNTNGTRTDVWKMTQPHAPYLVFMGVGDYAVVKDKYKNIAVDYYVEKEYAPYAKQIFGLTPEMIGFFAKITGIEYPWAKYAQMTARDYVSGAMENTTATLHQDGSQQNARELADGNRWEDVIAHEVFHHWFGNLATTESWSNLTMNESFANYSEYLWREYKYGKESADAHLFNDTQGYMMGNNFNKHLVRFHYRTPDDVFDAVSYNKGGAILHMLRYIIGDKAFYTSFNKLLTDKKYGTLEAHEFRLAVEEVTGKDMNWFFNQWFFNNGHPQLNINYASTANIATITIEQAQKNAPVFRFPLAIDIYVNGKKTRYDVWVKKAKETFTFPVTGKPELINADADKYLLATKTENKTIREYIAQYKYAGNFLDRREAVDFALKNITLPGSADFIINQALSDSNYLIRQMVLYGLNPQIMNAAAISKIENIATTDKHKPTRAAAIDILGYMRNAQYLPVFLANVNDSSYSVAGSALQSLSMLDRDKAMELLPALRKDAKGKLKMAVERLDMLNKTEADFEEMYSEYKNLNDINLKAEYTFDFMGYLLSINDAARFKQGVDEVVKYRDKVSEDYPPYKEAVNNFFKQIAQQKAVKKAGAANPEAIQEQIDYINLKIK